MKDYAPKLWLHTKTPTLAYFFWSGVVIASTLLFAYLLVERLAK